MRFSPDGNFLYSCARKDDAILCWDVRSTEGPLYSIPRHGQTNQRLGFEIEPCGRTLVTGGTVRVLVCRCGGGEGTIRFACSWLTAVPPLVLRKAGGKLPHRASRAPPAQDGIVRAFALADGSEVENFQASQDAVRQGATLYAFRIPRFASCTLTCLLIPAPPFLAVVVSLNADRSLRICRDSCPRVRAMFPRSFGQFIRAPCPHPVRSSLR